MSKNKSMDILDFYQKFYEKDNEMKKIFGNTEFLGFLIDDLGDIILTQYGIPEDKTVENSGDGFCRDYWTDLLFDFGEKRISKEKLVEELKKYRASK